MSKETIAMTSKKAQAAKPGERSFTLIETVIALGIVTFLIVQVATVQGNAIVFSDYGRHITQGTWLARRVLSQVEYYWRSKPFTDLITHVVDQKFEDFDEYSYSLEIKEWKFPLVNLLQQTLAGGGPQRGGEEKDAEKSAKDSRGSSGGGDSGLAQMIETGVKQVFGSEPVFLTAHVDISWAEGAQRASTGMTYLMTNQAKVDEALVALKGTYDAWIKRINTPSKVNGAPGAPGTPNGQPAPGTAQPNVPGDQMGAPNGPGGPAPIPGQSP